MAMAILRASLFVDSGRGGRGGFQMTLPLVTSGLGDFAKPLRCGLGDLTHFRGKESKVGFLQNL